MGADDEVDGARFDLREPLAAGGGRGRSRQERHPEARRLEQPGDVHEVLLGQNLGRRHERDLQIVFHRDERGEQRDDRLAGADVALQQPVHRLRQLHVFDDLFQCLLLAVRQLERQHGARRVADAIVHAHRTRLQLERRRLTTGLDAHVKQKGLLEDQPPLRRRRESVQRADRRILRREMRRVKRRVSRRQPKPSADLLGQKIRHVGRQPLQRLVHEPPLHLRRDGAGLLVDGHDAARVNGLSFFVVENLILRVRNLQGDRPAHFDRAVQHDTLPAHEDVPQVRLVQPHGAQRSAAVVDRGLENLEAGTPRGSKAARQHPAGDRRRLSGFQRGNRLQPAAIFIAQRKPVQQILDSRESRVLQVGGAPRPNAFQELKRGGQKGAGPLLAHCTIMACPRSTWISRMRAGSANGSSRLMPAGF